MRISSELLRDVRFNSCVRKEQDEEAKRLAEAREMRF